MTVFEELPPGMIPGSEAHMVYMAQKLAPPAAEPPPEEQVPSGAWDAIEAGLEMILQGIQELRNE